MWTLKHYRRSDVITLLALLVVILGFGAVQSFIVANFGLQTEHGRLLPGSGSYARLADDFIDGGLDWIDDPPGRLPGYTALVVVSKLIAGDYWAYLLIGIQGALGFVCGLLINRTAARVSPVPWIPAVVTLAYAFHFGLQREHFALRETVLYEFFIVAFFFAGARDTLSLRDIAVLTAASVLSYFTRPTGVLLTVALCVLLLVASRKTMGKRVATAGWAVGAVFIFVLPWQIYQSVYQDKVALAPIGLGGMNLYKGNSFLFEELSPYIDHDAGDVYLERINQEFRASTTAPGAAATEDDHLRQLARADIESDYLRYLRKAVLRTLTYLSPLETPLGTATLRQEGDRLHLDGYRGNFVSASAEWLPFAVQLSFFVVLFAVPLGFLGMVQSMLFNSRLRPVAAASFVFLLLNVASHAAITAETRYRLYLDPLFLVWAGLAIGLIFSRRST
jgi:hypothetical protein